MINNIYQKIVDEIIDFFPNRWEKVVVSLNYGEESYEISFYVKSNNEYIKCFDLNKVTDEDLLDAFGRIDCFVSVDREKLKDKWTNMTLILDNSGKVHVDYDYANHSQDGYQFNKEWKKKYLV